MAVACVLFSAREVVAQEPDVNFSVGIFTLDSFVVTDMQAGLRIEDFIDRIQNDTTFYRAFQNLRKIPYHGSANVRMFNSDHLVQASYSNNTEQSVDGTCRHLVFKEERATGDFFDDKGNMEYLTATLFSYIFLYRDTICASATAPEQLSRSATELEERKAQLKTLIFNPGQPVDGIPLIGNRMEIFSPEMQPYYNYDLRREHYSTGMDCYVFSITKKPEAEKGKDVVINELTTWFDVSTMQIVSRQYHLSYFTPVFDFDVRMDVRLEMLHGMRVPVMVQYNGFWDIPLQKPEIGSIQISTEG